jgi:hypothetical protein
MNDVFFHPKLVHLPMALGALMPLVAFAIALAWWRGWLPSKTWWLAVGLQLVLVGSSVVALRSGEAEEARVEPIVGESRLEAHEEAAKIFTASTAFVLVMMVTAAAAHTKRSGLPLALGASMATLAVLGLGIRTGGAGGRLVYEHGAASAYTKGATGNAAEPGHDGAKRGAAEASGHEAGDDD